MTTILTQGVSQDGDVRAMTRVQDMLIVWENIQLHTNIS